MIVAGNLLNKVGDALGASADFLTSMVELLEALGSWNNLLAASVRHPVVLQLVLENPDDDGVGDGAADVGCSDSVQTLVLCDVILKEQRVGLWWVVVGLDTVGFFQWMVVLVPDNLGLGYTKDGALDFATVHPN